jgi:hypothetical protein
MPDALGKLSAEEMAKMDAWFKQHWTQQVLCPVCGSGSWTKNDYLGHAMAQPASILKPGVPTTPFVMVHSPCGYVMFFNAVLMGLWSPYRPPGTS